MMLLTVPQLVCFGLMFLGLGLFVGTVLLAWLDEREDAYAGIRWSRALGLDSNYPARASLAYGTIRTVCAYCRRRTTSVWCAPCRRYYCLAHNARAHRACALEVV